MFVQLATKQEHNNNDHNNKTETAAANPNDISKNRCE